MEKKLCMELDILTQNGWKSISSIDKSEEILAFKRNENSIYSNRIVDCKLSCSELPNNEVGIELSTNNYYICMYGLKENIIQVHRNKTTKKDSCFLDEKLKDIKITSKYSILNAFNHINNISRFTYDDCLLIIFMIYKKNCEKNILKTDEENGNIYWSRSKKDKDILASNKMLSRKIKINNSSKTTKAIISDRYITNNINKKFLGLTVDDINTEEFIAAFRSIEEYIRDSNEQTIINTEEFRELYEITCFFAGLKMNYSNFTNKSKLDFRDKLSLVSCGQKIEFTSDLARLELDIDKEEWLCVKAENTIYMIK